MFKNRPFLLPAFFMLPALFCLLSMGRSVKDGTFNIQVFENKPVAETEFLITDEEVLNFYGRKNDDSRRSNTQKMRQAHFFDNLFLIFYSIFLGGFAVRSFLLTRQKSLLLAAFLAVVIALSDLFENGAILKIINGLDSSEATFSDSLRQLKLFTWLKWVSIGAYFGLLISFFKKAPALGKPRWLATVLLVICWATLILALLAFFRKDLTAAFWMSQAITLAFVGLFLFSISFKKHVETSPPS